MNMHPLAKKLLVSRQLQLEEGDVEVLGDRMVIIPADVLVEMNELLEKKNVYRIGELIGEKMAVTLKKYGMKDTKLIEFCLNLMSLYGWGKPEIKRMGKVIFITVRDSVIAIRAAKKEKAPERACDILAGVFGGLFMEALGRKVSAQEVKCFAKGEKICEFEIK